MNNDKTVTMSRELAERIENLLRDAFGSTQAGTDLSALLAAPVVEQPAPVSVDACDHCGKHTQGLDGETKWCTYCGGKL